MAEPGDSRFNPHMTSQNSNYRDLGAEAGAKPIPSARTTACQECPHVVAYFCNFGCGARDLYTIPGIIISTPERDVIIRGSIRHAM